MKNEDESMKKRIENEEEEEKENVKEEANSSMEDWINRNLLPCPCTGNYFVVTALTILIRLVCV